MPAFGDKGYLDWLHQALYDDAYILDVSWNTKLKRAEIMCFPTDLDQCVSATYLTKEMADNTPKFTELLTNFKSKMLMSIQSYKNRRNVLMTT
jgi:hypothetical protein